MSSASPLSLWSVSQADGESSNRFVVGGSAHASLQEIANGSTLDARGEELRGRSVLITTRDQFTAALALFELDGIAQRIVLYPPDLPLDYLPSVIQRAQVDAIVSDRASLGPVIPRVKFFMENAKNLVRQNCDRTSQVATEWILLTSGTSGVPKLVLHTLSSLAGAIPPGLSGLGLVWSTFYDIRRYGGLTIFLRAILTGSSLVLSSSHESTAEFLARASAHGVTHISGTPSHWRRALMSSSAHQISPRYVRLSGEVADDAILSSLRATYPQAQLVHAFASTEAGLVFEVKDGFAGFPAEMLEHTPGVEMQIRNGTLCVRSNRTATRYLGEDVAPLRDAEGFVDTADLIDQRDARCYFMGRRDGLINVGGLKVYPEEIEAVINRHPEVQMSLVKTKKSPITGAVVVADVVLRQDPSAANRDLQAVRNDILLCCRRTLSTHKVPAVINFLPALAVGESGKMLRNPI